MEISNTAQLKTYLEKNEIPFQSIEQLEGGLTNHVFRITIPSGDTTILKHASSLIATSSAETAFHLPVDRMDFEHTALTALSNHIPSNTPIQLPHIHSYDQENHILTMSDGGPRTLKAAYTDPTLDIPALGAHLGRYLANLHASTRTTDIGDNKTAKAIAPYAYTHLASVLEQYNHPPTLAPLINARYGTLLQTDNECICHGDFWPGNVLLSTTTTTATHSPNLTIVDWELVRRGCGATDVGQFAAEAYLLDRFRGRRDLLPAFLTSYQREGGAGGGRKLGKEFLLRVAVQMGVHLAFWPTRVEWGTKGDTGMCVGVGVGLLQRVVGGGEGVGDLEGLLGVLGG